MSIHRALVTLLAAMFISASGTGIASVQGDPKPAPTGIASQFQSLITQFKSDEAGYTCYRAIGVEDGLVCALALRCSLSLVAVEGDSVREIGMNFGGALNLNDAECVQPYFISQISTMLEIFRTIPKERAREIITIMEHESEKYGSCHPDRLGELPEGRGGLSFGRDEEVYGPNRLEGRRILKIFCWSTK